MSARILAGDCRLRLRDIPDRSVHAVVCDPPYDLVSGRGASGGFMGERWDATGVAFDPKTWRAVLRTLRPGGHLLAFGGTRTYHRLAAAVEDAGFEVRDCLMWIYGTGFPKSLDVSKAIDKAAGAEREVVGSKVGLPGYRDGETGERGVDYGGGLSNGSAKSAITVPATDAARQWSGWGTALKPAWEPIIVARKPLCGTVAENVLEHGTGGVNIDACRVVGATSYSPGGFPERTDRPEREGREEARGRAWARIGEKPPTPQVAGRWPANVLLSHAPECSETSCVDGCPVALLDEQSRGGASRFFNQLPLDGDEYPPFVYTAKASRSEREAGLSGNGKDRANRHPCVKPVAVMAHLVRLACPVGGLVLDPFAGSGSTGVACVQERRAFVGIERETRYVEIARARVAHATKLASGGGE